MGNPDSLRDNWGIERESLSKSKTTNWADKFKLVDKGSYGFGAKYVSEEQSVYDKLDYQVDTSRIPSENNRLKKETIYLVVYTLNEGLETLCSQNQLSKRFTTN